MNSNTIKEIFQFYGCDELIVMTTYKKNEMITYWSSKQERLTANHILRTEGKAEMVKYWCHVIEANPDKIFKK